MNPDSRALKAALLHRFSELKILVVGDLMLDKYLWGHAARISPEAPVPVVHLKRESHSLGGAANVARNLISLGARAELAGFIGQDLNGELVKRECDSLGIGRAAIVELTEFPTITKTRVLADDRQLLRVDDETQESRSERESDALLSEIQSRLENESFDAVILSDYAKGVASPHFCRGLMALCEAFCIPVYVDPKGRDYAKYRGARAIKPNRLELQEIARALDWEGAPLELGAKLRDYCESEWILLTLGAQGLAAISAAQTQQFPAKAREVFDVSGAGDTTMATFVCALASGLDLENSAWLANLAASQVVAHLGATTISREELLLALQNETRRGGESKFYAWDELETVLSAWRAGGQTVAFTNGCFDLLHAGHVRLLEDCAALADKLVVAINSDASVSRLKGESRPLMPQSERAAVLAALGCVDAVAVFEEDTPLRLIELVKPDVLIKGGDYTRDTVVGADVVEQNGGRVAIVPLVPGKSTTALAEKIGRL